MDNKRFITFLMFTMLIVVGYIQLRVIMNPPPADDVAQQDGEGDDAEQPGDGPDEPGDDGEGTDDAMPPEDGGEPPVEGEDEAGDFTSAKKFPPQWTSLGSVNPADDYRMLLIFSNRGASLVRAELSSVEYRDLEDDDGYLGHLELTNGEHGAVINVVGKGTPAAHAECTSGGRKGGLQVGDQILKFNETSLEKLSDDDGGYAGHYLQLFHETNPGETVTLVVRPKDALEGSNQTLTYKASLTRPPMQVIQPEHFVFNDPATPEQPFSFLTTLSRPDSSSFETKLPALRNGTWEMTKSDSGEQVQFRYRLSQKELEAVGTNGPLEIIKTFTLDKVDNNQPADERPPGYSMHYTLEVKNLSEVEEADIRLRQDGPTGLPLEGWWYIRKGSPHWGSAGVRDIVWSTVDKPGLELIRNPVIFSHFTDDDTTTDPFPPFGIKGPTGELPQTRFVGVDSPYFSAVMLPDEEAASFSPSKFRYARADAIVISELDKKRRQTTGITFRLFSDETLRPGETFRQDYTVFIGPKAPSVLSHYGLEGTIIYGWAFFGYIARILLWGLNLIYGVIPNYGIAIILLTVCVRLMVLPIGRKQAQNAAMMQKLAPEMKAIADKHKEDMEARTKATQELWKKHNYNPFGGCWLMFLQLPIFFGLYKALSVSIDLRQASLIPGIRWCSNLAAPDMFWYWKPYLPEFLAGYNGYLGPFLNILPLVTIALFIVHQKLFTPPPTDDNQALQQKMMSYMMIFMGFLFFKVPSGLCLYFITSSLWGIAERKLFPKPKTPAAGPVKKDDAAKKPTSSLDKPKKTASKENTLAEMFNNLLQRPTKTNGDDNPKRRPRRKKKRK